MGQKTGIAVQFAKGCSAIYAVAAGLVFNASQTTSIPNIPIPVPAPVQDNSVSAAGAPAPVHCWQPPVREGSDPRGGSRSAARVAYSSGRCVVQGLSKTAETVIIVVCVVIGGGFLCLCGALYYMYKRERRGEPLFSRLEEVRVATRLVSVLKLPRTCDAAAWNLRRRCLDPNAKRVSLWFRWKWMRKQAGRRAPLGLNPRLEIDR